MARSGHEGLSTRPVTALVVRRLRAGGDQPKMLYPLLPGTTANRSLHNLYNPIGKWIFANCSGALLCSGIRISQ